MPVEVQGLGAEPPVLPEGLEQGPAVVPEPPAQLGEPVLLWLVLALEYTAEQERLCQIRCRLYLRYRLIFCQPNNRALPVLARPLQKPSLRRNR